MRVSQAGEDLEDDEEDKEEDVEQNVAGPSSEGLSDAAETTPLLRSGSRSRSHTRRRRSSVGPHGNATVTQAVLMVSCTAQVYFSC